MTKIEVIFHFYKRDVIFHMMSRWVNIMVEWCGFLADTNTTPTKIVSFVGWVVAIVYVH